MYVCMRVCVCVCVCVCVWWEGEGELEVGVVWVWLENSSITLAISFCALSTVEIQLDKISEIDYALLEAPNFTSTYIETNHKVRVQSA